MLYLKILKTSNDRFADRAYVVGTNVLPFADMKIAEPFRSLKVFDVDRVQEDWNYLQVAVKMTPKH